MSIVGLTLPQLSAYDPPVAGEGSIDPMGLAAISDRLADHLVPAVRARMSRIRFVTASAVGALAHEELADLPPLDGTTSPPIAFEWIVLEAFARRLRDRMGVGVPGSQKALLVVRGSQRLSAATYLKAPSNFGFTAVYKPLAVDALVITEEYAPAERCAELVRAWEDDQGLEGFVDARPGTVGGALRTRATAAIRESMLGGRCAPRPGASLFTELAQSLAPGGIGIREGRALRALVFDDAHPERAELARLLDRAGADLSEAELLRAVHPRASPALIARIDAVQAYEALAKLLDTVFDTLCFVSKSQGSQPLTPHQLRNHELVRQAARQLPGAFRTALDQIGAIDTELIPTVEARLGVFAIKRKPDELVQLILEHHLTVQARKLPHGKRPWFEPFGGGWVVRPGFGDDELPKNDGLFVHPVRVASLRQFLADTA